MPIIPRALVSLALLHLAPIAAYAQRGDVIPQTVILVADSTRIRGLHCTSSEWFKALVPSGGRSIDPLRLRRASGGELVVFVWLVDANWNGAERYDHVAVSTTDDFKNFPDPFQLLTAGRPERVAALALPEQILTTVLLTVSDPRDASSITIRIEPDPRR